MRDQGLTLEMFLNEARVVFDFIVEHFREHGEVPQRDTIIDECDLERRAIFEPDEPTTYYAQKVRERFALNAQKRAAGGLPEAIKDRDPEKVHEVAREIVAAGMDILDGARGSVVDTNANQAERLARYEARKNSGGITGIRSPWDAIDQETGGWKPENLITIVARLGVGKTFCALVCAAHARSQGNRVSIVSMEMSSEALQTRLDAIELFLPYRDLLRGELDHETEARYREALSTDRNLPSLYIAAGDRINTVADVDLFVQETRPQYLLVDGAYLLFEGGKNTPRHERVELVQRKLKKLARKRRIPVKQTMQLNRTGTGSRAGAENIGHTDAVGQDSDIIIALHQDQGQRNANQMGARLIKNREGRLLEMLLNWDMVAMDFSAVAGAAPQAYHDGDGGDDAHGQAEIPF